MNMPFTFTVKEVANQQLDNEKSSKNSFKYGRKAETQSLAEESEENSDNPFKNLATVNVV